MAGFSRLSSVWVHARTVASASDKRRFLVTALPDPAPLPPPRPRPPPHPPRPLEPPGLLPPPPPEPPLDRPLAPRLAPKGSPHKSSKASQPPAGFASEISTRPSDTRVLALALLAMAWYVSAT
eukprot:6415039-Pyramimonas_sp.AAC.1